MKALTFLISTAIPWVYSEFLNPPADGAVWRIGEIQQVRYNTTFENYNIAIWQESLSGDSASIGPIIYREFLSLCKVYGERADSEASRAH